jgi:aspartate/tyrosine/aromatic aminotransferase
VFESFSPAPPDPILGLTEAFKADPNPAKVNLGVGVYQDENGRTPVLPSVKAAEAALLGAETTKSYLPIAGDPDYARRVEALVFGAERESALRGRARTAYAPGGTGALRVGADLVADSAGRGRGAWISAPTWPNHRGLFAAAGFEVREVPYFDPATSSLRRDAFLDALRTIPAGDVVVLHAGCHNPTGVDPDAAVWREVVAIAAERGWLPFVDSAYLGFGDGLEADAAPLRMMFDAGVEFMASISFSKNMGLYRDRVGALTVVAKDPKAADVVFSRIKKTIRVLYSNPAAHGPLTAAMVLSDRMLRAMWDAELAAMRTRLHAVRAAFADGLAARVKDRGFDFIRAQRGMFSFTGLTPAQVAFLRETKSIYMTADGRANVVGLLPGNIDLVCDAIAESLRAAG